MAFHRKVFFKSKTHFECIVPNALSSLFDIHVTYYLAGSSDTDFDANGSDKVGHDPIHLHSHLHAHTYTRTRS